MMPLLAQAAGGAATQSVAAEAIVFWIFAVVGIGAALALILMRNVVHAALMLVLNLLAIAVLYLALQSSFLGIIQVIVYAGAIMVLFLFVIMLLGVDRDDQLIDRRRWHRIGAAVATAAVVAGLLFAFGGSFGRASLCGGQAGEARAASTSTTCVGLDEALADNDNGAVGVLADRLFTRYTFPFEAAALLLTVATIGALVLGRRGDPAPEARAEPVAKDVPGGVADEPEGPSDADRVLPAERRSGERDL